MLRLFSILALLTTIGLTGCTVQPAPQVQTIPHKASRLREGSLDRGIYVYCADGKQYLVVVDLDGTAVTRHAGKVEMKNGDLRVVRQGSLDRGIYTYEVDELKYLIVVDLDGVGISAAN
jgi:hypothetical protein